MRSRRPGARIESQAIGVAATVVINAPTSARTTVSPSAGPISSSRQTPTPPKASQCVNVTNGTPIARTVTTTGSRRHGTVLRPRRQSRGALAAPAPTRA